MGSYYIHVCVCTTGQNLCSTMCLWRTAHVQTSAALPVQQPSDARGWQDKSAGHSAGVWPSAWTLQKPCNCTCSCFSVSSCNQLYVFHSNAITSLCRCFKDSLSFVECCVFILTALSSSWVVSAVSVTESGRSQQEMNFLMTTMTSKST